MSTWKDYYLSVDNWTTWDHALAQHRQLLITGGQVCKLLFRNPDGQEVGSEETPIPISSWDTTAGHPPKKIIWMTGDDIEVYPNPQSVRVWVDGNELHKTYNAQTIQFDTEFYVEIDNNLVSVQDNVSINFNSTFNPTGHSVTYLYTARSKSIDKYNLQPAQDTVTFRSPFGFTQYLDPTFTFRGISYQHSFLVSFPPPPAFDTRFYNFGATQEWQNRAWTVGAPLLHEFDVIYRLSDGRWYEIKDWEPNPIFYRGNWVTLTQSFTLTQLGPNDILRQFQVL